MSLSGITAKPRSIEMPRSCELPTRQDARHDEDYLNTWYVCTKTSVIVIR